MRRFTHITPASLEQVIPLLDAATRPIAGGTDMIPLIEGHLRQPERLVNIKPLAELRGILEEDGGLQIGALTTLVELQRSPLLAGPGYAALAEAANLAASPQLRAMATIGGNLLQEVRCWYYRGPFNCWLKGGDECQARDGENQYHAIWDQSPCVAVQPSDPATALVALDATVTITGASGTRTVAVSELLAAPTSERRRLHTLGENELITAVGLPARTGWRSLYRKAMERAVWAFALVGVAVAARTDGNTISDVRVVLGGVANVPVRVTAAEDLLRGQVFSSELAQQAGALAIAEAQPLAKNGYKLDLVQGMVAAALGELLSR